MFKKDILKLNEDRVTVILFKNGARFLSYGGVNYTQAALEIQAQAKLPGNRGTVTVAIVPEDTPSDITLLQKEREFNLAYYDHAPGTIIHINGGTRYILEKELAGYGLFVRENGVCFFINKEGSWTPQPKTGNLEVLQAWIGTLVLFNTDKEALWEINTGHFRQKLGVFPAAIGIYEGKIN